MNDEMIMASLFDQCLHKLEQGNRLEEVLAEYPEMSRELRPLLEASLLAKEVNTTIQVSQTAFCAQPREFSERRCSNKVDLSPQPSFYQAFAEDNARHAGGNFPFDGDGHQPCFCTCFTR